MMRDSKKKRYAVMIATILVMGMCVYGSDGRGRYNFGPFTVIQGGTGLASLTDGGVLLGSGTGAITALSVLADGEFIVGDGTTDPAAESGATARTSLGLGTGDSPVFANVSLGTGQLTSSKIITTSGNFTILPTSGITVIGDAGTTSRSLNTDDDLFVSGELEVDGNTFFDAPASFFDGLKLTNNSEVRFGSNDNSRLDWATSQATVNTLVWSLDDTAKSLIFTTSTNRAKDFDHAAQTNPTIIIHSATDPDTDNTQWTSLTHDQTKSVITTGKGNILLTPALEVPAAGAVFYGDETTNNTWKTVRDGTKLSFQRRESGNYVEKGFFDTSFYVDVLEECTAGSGVTIDGMLIKDGGLSAVKTGGSAIIAERSEAATGTSLRASELHRTTTGTAAAGIGAELAFRVEDDGGALETAATIGGTLTDVSAASEEGALIFEVASDSSLVEGMRIQGLSGGSANVEIPGNINVTEDFYIYDAARGRISVQTDGTYLFNPAGGLWFGMKDDGNSSKGNIYPSVDDTYDLGTSSLRWDDVWATNGTIQTSDERRKKDIADLNYGIDEISQLRPISFKWKKSKDNRTKLGLIAQEIVDILPEVVYGSEEESYGINYGDLVPIMIKAIQEQQKQIDELTERIEKMERK